jgi:diaminohydroxyphosphoribosylaminopyrimidine deaminase/5-amino-6-(5-phosphoribosylamino)uracil reductase
VAITAADERFMAAAIRYSRRHLGLTGDNPSVGALIVRDGTIVGRGVTAPGGRPHAEAVALSEAGEATRGASAYVTLEPCSHYGRTAPCADALAAAGIARVVVALLDPDPRVKGRGVRHLREAGVEVEIGCLEEEARRAMEGFLSLKERGRPFMTLKLAVSADGMLGRSDTGNVAITGPLAHTAVHALRAENEAVMVGAGTAVLDDPLLTARLPGFRPRKLTRVVIDPMARTPPTARMLADIGVGPVVVMATAKAPKGKLTALERAGAAVKTLMSDHKGNVQPAEILRVLGLLGIKSVLLEGGAETARRFLAAGLVDRIALFAGAVSVGEGGVPAPLSAGATPQGFRAEDEKCYGDDRLIVFGKA